MGYYFFLSPEKRSKKERFVSVFVHPAQAVETAKSNFNLTKKEEDMIRAHMFPINLTVPKYLESWIVNLVDDFACFYERSYVLKENMSVACSMVILLFMIFFKRW